MFYNSHSLIDSGENGSYFNEFPFLSLKEIEARLKKAEGNEISRYIKNKEIDFTGYKIQVHKQQDGNSATLSVVLNSKSGKYEHTRIVASVQISTVFYNCGAIHVSNINANQSYGTGLAWEFYKHVEAWCKWAGYTFLFGNVAGNQQLALIPKLEALGYERMGPDYINRRSANKNVWFCKIIADQPNMDTYVEEDEDDYDDEPDFEDI